MPPMEHIEDKKKWLANYRETTALLEQIRNDELRALTDDQAVRIIASLNVVGTPWRERPDWSGLVEQQALFHRVRKS